MVYRLTCPACKHVQESPFVRLGAVAPCPACHKAFRVGAGMIVKVSTVQQQGQPTPTATRAAAGGASQAAAPGDSAAGIVGLSGLSQVMREQAGESGQRPALDAPPSARPAGGAGGPGGGASAPLTAQQMQQQRGRQRALDAARRRRRRLLLGLLVAMTLVIGLVGVVIAMMASRPAVDATPGGDHGIGQTMTDGTQAPVVVTARVVGLDHAAFFAQTRLDVRATVTPRRAADSMSGEGGDDSNDGGAGDDGEAGRGIGDAGDGEVGAEIQTEAAGVSQLTARLVATENAPPLPPFDLLLTASNAQGNLGAWVLRFDGAVGHDMPVRFTIRLGTPFVVDGEAQWSLSAYQGDAEGSAE